jgi:hypothetical protein
MMHFSARRKGPEAVGRQGMVMRPCVVAATLLQVLLFCLLGAAAAFATDINASWEYQLNGGEEEETRDRLLQKYFLATGFSLEPTDAITTGANLAYSRSHVTDIGTNETVTPSANFALSNDIFVAALDGTLSQNRTPSSGTLDTYSWSASLGSGWQRPYWPTPRLYYDENGQDSEEQSIDLSEYSYGLDINWQLPATTLFYGFNQRRSEDHINLNQVDATSHLARLETGGNFFANRFSVKLIETFTNTSEEFKIGEGGEIDVELTLNRFAAVDSNPNL